MIRRPSRDGGGLRLGGSLTALPTPFRGGKIDQQSLGALCERQIARGTSALVVCGSTGEAAAMNPGEQNLALSVAVEATAGRVPVIAGCSAPSTAFAAALAVSARLHGAAALLCAPPPYVRPTQAGVIAHMGTLRRVSDLPILIYDVPGRTGIAIADETLARLYEQGSIIGIKDATADLARPPRLRALCGGDFIQLSGNDGTAAAYRAAGGHGCVSVTANVTPTLCSMLHQAWDDGDLCTFASMRDRLAPLSDVLFAESNPIPVKTALSQLGLLHAEFRLPLTPSAQATVSRLLRVLPPLLKAEDGFAGQPCHALAS